MPLQRHELRRARRAVRATLADQITSLQDTLVHDGRMVSAHHRARDADITRVQQKIRPAYKAWSSLAT